MRIGSANAANLMNAFQIDASGNATVAGNIAAASKSFRITHPLDDTKDLIHGSLEGPEYGVYYRGEVTTVDGAAEVTLPDYFEALTSADNRTVLLTQIEDGAEFSMLTATRVSEGKFTIYSSEPAVTVSWEVKAVRGDIPPLEVVANKPAEPAPPPIPGQEPTPEKKTRRR